MQSPIYLFNKKKLIDNYQSISDRLLVDDVYYALKANAEPLVLRVLAEIGAKFETASLGELRELTNLCVNPERILLGLPIKTTEIIQKAYSVGCRYFVFDHIDEYHKICSATGNANDTIKVMRIFISDICPGAIEFGVKLADAKAFFEQNAAEGLSFHISGNVDADSALRALSRAEEILACIGNLKHGFILNIGGGFHLPLEEEYTQRINEKLISLKQKYGLRIICEPGQAVVKTAGTLISTVVAIRQQDGYQDVYLNAGYPTGVNRAPEYIKLFRQTETPTRGKIRIYRFFDNTCMHQELFTKPLRFDLKENDMLELGHFGSYSLCKANHFHCWEKPGVVLEEGGNTR